MRNTPFFKLGLLIYNSRIPLIILLMALVVCCIPCLPNILTPFQSTGFVADNSTSAKTNHYLNQKLGYTNNQLLILYHSHQLNAENNLFNNKINQSLRGLKNYPIKHDILLPGSNKKQISKDKHTAYAVIIFKNKEPLSSTQLNEIKSLIKTPKQMTLKFGGEPVFIDGLNVQTQKDLSRADIVAAPVSIITLILIFGSVIAAIVPIILGASCAMLILVGLYLFAHAFTLSIFTLNIALLLGLCLNLDYSLFMISRFREELKQNKSVPDAIAITLATAGKSVFFSGLAVFASLSALLFFPVNILFSVGVGGLTAVFISVLVAIIILPAVLSVLGTSINRLPVQLFKPRKDCTSPTWHWIAFHVVKRPMLFFITALIILLLLGAPFLNAHIGVSDEHILPEHSASRVFFDTYEKEFNKHDLTPIRLVVSTNDGSILSSKNIARLYDFSKQLKTNPAISNVNSIVTLQPALSKTQYQMLYSSSKRYDDPSIKALLKTTTSKQFTVIDVISKYDANSSENTKLIKQLRSMQPGKGLTLQVTGLYVTNQDVLESIAQVFPYAITWIIGLTYLILLILLRSIFLPIKAILMNILSLCASYGVLVFIFQEGHLHQLLHFSPQHIVDVSLMVIIFCALFGLSMDYEVFLLTRIQESYLRYKDNNRSIIYGIEHSSRIITSAALIVIVICASFMVADVLMVKEFGLGIAAAITVDAFLVRSLLVPATMALINQWNWYLPKWLDKILP